VRGATVAAQPTVEVMLGDMGMTQMMGGTAPLGGHMMLRVTPATVPAGQVSLVVSNMGWRTHELVVLPLAAGASAGQRVPGADGKVEETGSLGEVSNSCAAGAGDGITAGAVGWNTVRCRRDTTSWCATWKTTTRTGCTRLSWCPDVDGCAPSGPRRVRQSHQSGD
jgi:hypothetical protein